MATRVPAPPAAPAGPPPADVDDHGSVRRDAVRARRWEATGAARVVRDVDADRVDLGGLITIGGALRAREVASRGTLEVGGPVEVAEALTIEGSARIGAGLSAGSAHLRGRLECGGSLRVTGRTEWTGHLDARGDLAGGPVLFDGRLTLDGALTATTLDGRLRGRSRADRLAAERITLRAPRRLGPRGELTVLRIDAREVDLEGVVCEYLRADRIVLGAGCEIARVDGTIVRQHAGGHVGPVSRSPPPPGLSR